MRPRVARVLIGAALAAVAALIQLRVGSSDPVPSDLAVRAHAAIAAREYHASPTSHGLQAPNRAHGLRTYFEPGGIRVLERESGEDLVSLSLSAMGRAESLAATSDGTITSRAERVEIRRPGVVEWYLNGPDGLEQGFTVERSPSGAGELVLELALAGARARPLSPGTLAFESANGRSLRYGGLRAEDATGRALPTRLELRGDSRVRLVVADAGATYPIVVDPLLSGTTDSVLELVGSGYLAGWSVSSGCDVNGDGYGDAIVSAPHHVETLASEGAVFIFHGGPGGVVSAPLAEATTTLLGNLEGAYFGSGAACAGDVNRDGYEDVIVGATRYDAITAPSAYGRVFVFHGSPSGIENGGPATASTTLIGAGGGGYALGFGQIVAGAGDVNGDGYDDVAVTALTAPLPFLSSGPGRVYVYHGGSGGITSGDLAVAASAISGQILTPPFTNLFFGNSLAGAGDVNADGFDDLLVGAPEFATFELDEGAAFLFLGSGSGVASGFAMSVASARLESNTINARLGDSVSSAGDVNGDGYADIVLGAPGSGRAYLFHGGASGIAGGNLSGAAALLPAAGAVSAFGTTVAAAGDVNGDGYADVSVGTPADPGRVDVFLGGPGGIAGAPWAGFDGASAEAYLGDGIAVGPAGDLDGDGYDDVIAGALGYAPPDYRGAAQISRGGAPGVSSGGAASAARRIHANQSGAFLGVSVSSAGDVNADGFADVIVGAMQYDHGQSNEGAAFIFHGSASSLPLGDPNNAAAILESDQEGSLFGENVAAAGDVNGDGYGDVLVGASQYASGQSQEGAAFLFLGSASGVGSASAIDAAGVFETDQAGAFGGDSVAGADLNGDGFSDVIVSAPRYDAGQSDEGAVFVLHGGLAGIGRRSPITTSIVLEGGAADLLFGVTVRGAGDVNGDGFEDLLAAAAAYSGGEANEGAVFVFHGSALGIASGTVASAASGIESDEVGAYLSSAAAAGDVNGDGFDDLVLALPGRAFLRLGSASGIDPGGLAASHSSVSLGSTPYQTSIAGAGDVNGDGFHDVVVGQIHHTVDLAAEGAAFLYHGRADGLVFGSTATTLQGDQSLSYFGLDVASAGDVNGDGFADVLIGALEMDAPESDEGNAFVFLGNRAGRPVRARQRTSGTLAVRARGGDSTAADGFVAELTATHFGGRGLVSAEFQSCPVGVAFGAPGCATGLTSWSSVGPASPQALFLWQFTGLDPGVPQRWRARTLRRDDTGVAPPVPRHGPWRYLAAAPATLDVRTDLDSDGDTIANAVDNCLYAPNASQADSGGLAPSAAPDAIGNACQCGDVEGDGRVGSEDVTALRSALADPSGAPLGAAALARCVVLRAGSACDVVQLSVLRRMTELSPQAPVTTTPAAQMCDAALPPAG